MKRPGGVEASIILIFLFGGFSLLIFLVVLIMLGYYPGYDIIGEIVLSKISFITWALVWMFVLILLIVGGIGLIKYKKWARKLVVYTSFAGILALVFSTLATGSIVIGIIPLALFAWLILYFNKKEIIKLFKA
ncbi:hypothetical protein KY343_04465 [Candidatus Woesearchaeota archaeon]|nr:hypothetical protein [Candidatus Woesearchaeota archaeon]